MALTYSQNARNRVFRGPNFQNFPGACLRTPYTSQVLLPPHQHFIAPPVLFKTSKRGAHINIHNVEITHLRYIHPVCKSDRPLTTIITGISCV